MKFQSNCNCNRLHLHVIDPNSDDDVVISTSIAGTVFQYHLLICPFKQSV